MSLVIVTQCDNIEGGDDNGDNNVKNGGNNPGCMMVVMLKAWGVQPTHPPDKPTQPNRTRLLPPDPTTPIVECRSRNSKTRCQRVGYGSHIPKPMKPELTEKHQVQ